MFKQVQPDLQPSRISDLHELGYPQQVEQERDSRSSLASMYLVDSAGEKRTLQRSGQGTAHLREIARGSQKGV